MNHSLAHANDGSWHQSIYDQLYRLAEVALTREKPGHSLQPTLVVNDAYMVLMRQGNVRAGDRAQVLAAGATIIRRILVDYARRRKAAKRGGAKGRGGAFDGDVLQNDSVCVRVNGSTHGNTDAITDPLDIIELSQALTVLQSESPRAAQVVELRFFGGLSNDEIAAVLGISARSVSNDWRYARAWLYRALTS